MVLEVAYIFKSFNLSADDAKNFEKYMESFNNHIISKKNVIHSRAKIHQRQQQKGETTESFIRKVKNTNFAYL